MLIIRQIHGVKLDFQNLVTGRHQTDFHRLIVDQHLTDVFRQKFPVFPRYQFQKLFFENIRFALNIQQIQKCSVGIFDTVVAHNHKRTV